ncbi:MAG: 1-deoxy-D-xylulose-5-phosphate reductoisomerase, partial [Muribaculaceae bacterium]|nr:1-deoxy-D-xylulose-5-phosphate reductoisomerase [Muribaculaceae bacterium]
LTQMANLTFEAPDYEKFPLLRFAFSAIERGGNIPCILNAANEVAVDAFLHERLSFPGMGRLAEATIQAIPYIAYPTLPDLIATHAEATAKARDLLSAIH